MEEYGYDESTVAPAVIERAPITRRRLLVTGLASLGAPLLPFPMDDAYAADARFMTGYMPYDAFEELPKTRVAVEQGALEVGFAPGDMELSRERLINWVSRSARAVAIYYGRFPVPKAGVLIVPVAGRGVPGGQAFGYRGAAIRLMVGAASGEGDLKRDWKMVHEMIHLALPRVAQRHNWLSEGIAVYVESIARAQAGDLTNEAIWGEFVREMPRGLPESGDRGLDFTPTWGRTYWGGALFCLLADLEIRKRTDNRVGLQHALRGILTAGANHETSWPVERILRTADQATGATALADLYGEMRADPVGRDLAALWRDLGVSAKGGAAVFDNTAILAPARRAIMSPLGA